MLGLNVGCVMCGKESEGYVELDGLGFNITVRELLEDKGWIVQANGTHFDIYCSEECAK